MSAGPLITESDVPRSRSGAAATRGRYPADSTLAVVIPARNESARIERCLERARAALNAAGRGSAELLVVDDASEDGTGAVAAQWGATVLRQPIQRGPLAAWERGVEATAASIVVFVDADCELAPAAIRELLIPFAEPDVGVVSGRAVPLSLDQGGLLVRRSARFSAELMHQVKLRLVDHDFIPIGRLMAVRREAWKVDDPEQAPCDRVVAQLARRAGAGIRYAAAAAVGYVPPATPSSLRADYLRTNLPRRSLSPVQDRVPWRTLVRAGFTAWTAAPLDGLAWFLCRLGLLTAGMRERGRGPTEAW
ncbi:MAG: glycosyltransferase family 2 protein [Candidatus Dormibacteria bacterium]